MQGYIVSISKESAATFAACLLALILPNFHVFFLFKFFGLPATRLFHRPYPAHTFLIFQRFFVFHGTLLFTKSFIIRAKLILVLPILRHVGNVQVKVSVLRVDAEDGGREDALFVLFAHGFQSLRRCFGLALVGLVPAALSFPLLRFNLLLNKLLCLDLPP